MPSMLDLTGTTCHITGVNRRRHGMADDEDWRWADILTPGNETTSPDAEAYGALGSMDNMAMAIKRRKLSTASECQVENFLVMVLANGWWH